MSRSLLTATEQRFYFFVKVVPLLKIQLSAREVSKILNKSTVTIRTYIKRYGYSHHINLSAVGWKTIRFSYNYPPPDKQMEKDFLNRLKELDLLYILK
jgi:hypothetical protein